MVTDSRSWPVSCEFVDGADEMGSLHSNSHQGLLFYSRTYSTEERGARSSAVRLLIRVPLGIKSLVACTLSTSTCAVTFLPCIINDLFLAKATQTAGSYLTKCSSFFIDPNLSNPEIQKRIVTFNGVVSLKTSRRPHLAIKMCLSRRISLCAVDLPLLHVEQLLLFGHWTFTIFPAQHLVYRTQLFDHGGNRGREHGRGGGW